MEPTGAVVRFRWLIGATARGIPKMWLSIFAITFAAAAACAVASLLIQSSEDRTRSIR
jgi:hypothetical protein